MNTLQHPFDTQEDDLLHSSADFDHSESDQDSTYETPNETAASSTPMTSIPQGSIAQRSMVQLARQLGNAAFIKNVVQAKRKKKKKTKKNNSGGGSNPSRDTDNNVDVGGSTPMGDQFLANGGLEAMEGTRLATGSTAHTIERHVGKSDQYLIGRRIKYASTFSDLESANRAIATAMNEHDATIKSWLSGANKGARKDVQSQVSGIGRVVVSGKLPAIEATGVKVVMEKTVSGDFPMVLVTAYPVP